MPKVDHIQTSFAGGEFGASLRGRTDISQYETACQIVENFLIRPYGSAISTPGTKYVATVSDSTLKTRLVKFVFNRTDAYVIEMGDLYMRFYTNRGQVVTASGSEDLSSFSGNLLAHYLCNDNTNSTVVLDDTSSHNATSSTNTNNLHATGKVGTGCFDMNEGEYVIVPHHDDFDFSDATTGTNPFTLMGWIYYSNNGKHQPIIAKTDIGVHREWLLYLTSTGQFGLSLHDNTNGGSIVKRTNLPLAEGWHFVAATYDGRGGSSAYDGINIYVDGENQTNIYQKLSGTYSSIVTSSTLSILIGARYDNGAVTRVFADKIDNVAILDTEMASSDIASLYSSSAYQLTTIFEEDEIWDVQFTQLNDIIWLTHPNHPPQQLVRTAADEWAISDLAFLGGPFLDDNTDTSIEITPSGSSGTINLTVSPTNSNLFTLSSGTLGHHNSYWRLGGTLTNATTGLTEQGYVRIDDVINSYTATATVIKNLTVDSATTDWAEGAWSDVRGYPACVAFHERRLFFARTDHEPEKVWGSKVFLYDDFALEASGDSDGLNLALASNESNEIKWLASGKSLIAGTYGGAFTINSGSTETITPSNATATNEANVGTEAIIPKKIGNFLYYVQRFSKKLREFFYFWDLDTYKSVDKTIFAPHITEDGIVDLDYIQTPETILCCVLTNGTLAMMTREIDQEVTAWSKQTTNGTYTSIAVIPSQSEPYDEAWVIVERWINGSQKKYIEYFDNIEVPDRQDLCNYLHSTLTYNAYNVSSLTSCSISLSATGGSVTLTTSTSYFVAGDVDQRIRAIDADGTTIGEGTITAYTSGTSVTLSITTLFNTTAYTGGEWGLSVSSIAGLDHLEAETLGILADGQTESLTKTVASGAVTLDNDRFVIHAGLSYDQLLYTLPREIGSARGTAIGKLQRINEIGFKLNRSHQGFQIGPDADNLDTVNLLMSRTDTVTTLYTGIIANLSFRGGYVRGSQVYIKNADPLPMEILSIISTLETFDK